MRQTLILSFLLWSLGCAAQYAPQAGIGGSTAIAGSSGDIVGWASGCTIVRGLQDIDSAALGYATNGDSSMAIGAADGAVVSLGDSGVALLTFARPIADGPGADFAVFENGFADPTNDSFAFLELAFVEVSSDGTNYFRFPSVSNTQVTTQIPGSGVYMNACLLNDIGGKYIGGYGTPFDLQELAGTSGLDVSHITHVRIVDVIGDIGAHATHDSKGQKVNDPFPTPYPTSGFDLDAIAVLHQSPASVGNAASRPITSYPNPVSSEFTISCPSNFTGGKVCIFDMTGRTCLEAAIGAGDTRFSMDGYSHGLYVVIVNEANGGRWVEKISKL